MDSSEMDRLASRLTRQSPKRFGYVGLLRYAGMPEHHIGPIAWALYRRQHGLEARALVALVMAPQATDAGREPRAPAGPHAAIRGARVVAADPETPDRARERATDQLAIRSYLPPACRSAGAVELSGSCLLGRGAASDHRQRDCYLATDSHGDGWNRTSNVFGAPTPALHQSWGQLKARYAPNPEQTRSATPQDK